MLLLVLLALPLVLFLAVNLGWMQEIRTPVFSIPKLLVMRSGEISLQHIPENLKNLFTILWKQADGLPWNSPGAISLSGGMKGLYGLYYILTPPFLLLGLVSCARKLFGGGKEFRPAALVVIWLLAGLVLGALVHVNINRVNILFLPLLVLSAAGIAWFCELLRGKAAPVLAAAYLALFACFCGMYLNPQSDYQNNMRFNFGDGLGQALEAAMEHAGPIVLDGNIQYPTVLFYTGLPVEEFRGSVEYRNYPAAYLSALSFADFRFDYEGGAPEDGVCYILSPWTDASSLREAGLRSEQYGIYTVWTN